MTCNHVQRQSQYRFTFAGSRPGTSFVSFVERNHDIEVFPSSLTAVSTNAAVQGVHSQSWACVDSLDLELSLAVLGAMMRQGRCPSEDWSRQRE